MVKCLVKECNANVNGESSVLIQTIFEHVFVSLCVCVQGCLRTHTYLRARMRQCMHVFVCNPITHSTSECLTIN